MIASGIYHDVPAAAWKGGASGPASDAQIRIALQEVLAANYGLLFERLRRHLGCADAARECLHDAWLRLGDRAPAERIQNPEAYVYRVARNLAIDRLRTERAWRYADDPYIVLETAIDHAPGPEDMAEARAEVDSVHRAMQCLPRRHRAVLEALRIEEKTRQEVASHYGLSLRKVDTVLRQALEFCATRSGQEVLTGVSGPRRALQPQSAQLVEMRTG